MKFLTVLSILCGLLTPGLALDREAFTFTDYDLTVRIEPAQHRLAVRGKVTLRNDSSASQKNLILQISSSLDWRSIRIDGKPADFVSQPYASDIDHTGALSEAIVKLPAAVHPKGTVEVEVGYEGVVLQDATRLTRIGVPEGVAKHLNWDAIGKSFTAVRGVGYVAWYPIATESANLSEGNSVAEALKRWKVREVESEMHLELNYDPGNVENLPSVLCNGAMREAMAQEGASEFSTTRCLFSPIALDVPTFVIADYSLLDHATISVHYLPEHKSAAENFALASELATPLVTEWFGAPKKKVEVAELPEPEATPFEIGIMLLTPLATTDSRTYAAEAVHQLTHAAFPSPRPWIYEGLAHFAQAINAERQDGSPAALNLLQVHAGAIADAEKTLAAEKKSNSEQSESLVNTGSEELYRSKAMYVWWMLRDLIGEDALKKALALYRPEQDTDPAYMPRLIQVQSKRDLGWFFDDWVYHDRGLPDFRVDSASAQLTTGGAYLVTIVAENMGNAGAEVPMTARIDGGEVSKRLEVRAKSKVALRFEVPAKPESVVINDGSVPESDLSNNSSRIEIKTEASVRK